MSNTYDPFKKYIWDKDDKFELTGTEFALILNTIRGVLATPEAEKIILASKANVVIEEMMKKGVENGIMKEISSNAQLEKPKMKISK